VRGVDALKKDATRVEEGEPMRPGSARAGLLVRSVGAHGRSAHHLAVERVCCFHVEESQGRSEEALYRQSAFLDDADRFVHHRLRMNAARRVEATS